MMPVTPFPPTPVVSSIVPGPVAATNGHPVSRTTITGRKAGKRFGSDVSLAVGRGDPDA